MTQRTKLKEVQRNNRKWRKTLDKFPEQIIYDQYGRDLFAVMSLEAYHLLQNDD